MTYLKCRLRAMAGAACRAIPALAGAQPYPSQPIPVINPAAPGRQ